LSSGIAITIINRLSENIPPVLLHYQASPYIHREWLTTLLAQPMHG